MNFFAELQRPAVSIGVSSLFKRLRFVPSWLRGLPQSIRKNPFPLTIAGFGLIFAHVWIVILDPPLGDGYVYSVVALSIVLCVAVLLAHARVTSGILCLRWYLLAASMTSICILYLSGVLVGFTGRRFDDIGLVVQSAAGTLFILAITLPSAKRRRSELILDISIAVFFSFQRIVFEHSAHQIDAVSNVLYSHSLAYGLEVLLVGLALLAAPAAELAFFRGVAFYIVAMAVSSVLCNEIGNGLLHQYGNSPWMLTDTISWVIAAVYFLHIFLKRPEAGKQRPYRDVLTSLVPCTMSVLIVGLSMTLLSAHRYLALTGIVVGVVGFLARIVFTTLHHPDFVLEDNLVRELASEIMKDPLSSLGDRAELELALARVRPSVNFRSVLSLVLFAIDEPWSLAGTPGEEPEGRDLVPIARAIGRWKTPGSTICYLGSGRFAMLLPSTPLRIATPLAEQICLSVKSLPFSGDDAPANVLAGVAACAEQDKVFSLLNVASEALDGATLHRQARIFGTQSREQSTFDA